MPFISTLDTEIFLKRMEKLLQWKLRQIILLRKKWEELCGRTDGVEPSRKNDRFITKKNRSVKKKRLLRCETQLKSVGKLPGNRRLFRRGVMPARQ